jgi:hypothetical protein
VADAARIADPGWTTDYEWRKAEAKLNALPQFKTEIEHDIRRRSHEQAPT